MSHRRYSRFCLIVACVISAWSCSHDTVAEPEPKITNEQPLVLTQDGFTLKLFAPIVVGQASSVSTSYGPTNPVPASVRVLTTNAARVDGASVGRINTTTQLTGLASGDLSIRVISNADTTIQTTFRLSVELRRADTIMVDSSSYTVVGRDSAMIGFDVFDQAGHDTPTITVGVTSRDGGTTARVGTSTSGAPVIVVHGVKPGKSTLRLTAGSVSRDVPVNVISATKTDLVATQSGGSLDVAALSLPGIGDFNVTRQPKHGAASFTSGVLHYQPAAGFLGVDTVMYNAKTGSVLESVTTALDVLPGPFTATAVNLPSSVTPLGMNDVGQIYGTVTLGDGTKRAVRWSNGALDTLQYQGGATVPSGMDNTGLVVGSGGTTQVLWRPGLTSGESILGDAGSGWNVRISSGGIIVVDDPTSPTGGLTYNHYVVKSGAIEKRTNSIWRSSAVDEAGDYAGVLANSPYNTAQLQYADGHFGNFGGRGTEVAGMNNLAVVVFNAGESGAEPGSRPRVYANGVQTTLSDTYLTMSSVSGISDAGWMVGAIGRGKAALTPSPALFFNGAAGPMNLLLSDRSLVVTNIVNITTTGRILVSVQSGGVARLMTLSPAN